MGGGERKARTRTRRLLRPPFSFLHCSDMSELVGSSSVGHMAYAPCRSMTCIILGRDRSGPHSGLRVSLTLGGSSYHLINAVAQAQPPIAIYPLGCSRCCQIRVSMFHWPSPGPTSLLAQRNRSFVLKPNGAPKVQFWFCLRSSLRSTSPEEDKLQPRAAIDTSFPAQRNRSFV